MNKVFSRIGIEQAEMVVEFGCKGDSVLILKITLVPFFIAAVTLAGRRWGAGVAGLLAGCPVVAGPIVVFIAIEQGVPFGTTAAIAAISGIAGLLAFAIAYCWASLKWHWPVALICGIAAWFLAAAGLAMLPAVPRLTLAVATLSLLLAPRLLPHGLPLSTSGASLNDLPVRMITGGLLAFSVTTTAALLGEVWTGLLAVFPVIGLVLAVFTHRAYGPYQVAHMYRGMVQGLYSFAAFFFALAVLWPRTEFWSACALAVGAGIAVQAILQLIIRPGKTIRLTDKFWQR